MTLQTINLILIIGLYIVFAIDFILRSMVEKQKEEIMKRDGKMFKSINNTLKIHNQLIADLFTKIKKND